MASQQSSCSDVPPMPLLSILNVVVDHVMMEPCPLEPDEFYSLDGTENDNDIHNEKSDNYEAVELFPNNQKDNVAGTSFSDAFSSPSKTHNPSKQQNTSKGDVTSAAKSSALRVPVLRIFGPVLRNGDDSAYHKCTQDSSSGLSLSADSNSSSTNNNKSYSQQPQSGCLHIHGAYPYMLARPVIAGPDGSMHHGHYHLSNSQNSEGHDDVFSPKLSPDDDASKPSHIDWDNVDSVSHVLDDVHHRLEGSLRASVENMDSSHSTSRQSSQTMKYIRSVSIVTGRGFYTYCSGPPAPFLRVEYYDPSHRWRVKMILERGLELCGAYHPDPRVYDYESDREEMELGGNDSNVDNVRPLKFRCYEAHIPYTMQVFKDYNLAGLKYVNVGDVRFRQPLPRSLRKRTKADFLRKGSPNQDNCAFFLKDNVGKDLLWPRYEDASSQSQHQSNSLTHQLQHWLKKQTSCDLEFDTTVENILNVHDVMTALPSPLEERQQIHWRAVPSLREIWEQERKRMKILLSPENDFLSFEEEDAGDDSDSSDSTSSDEDLQFVPQEDSIPQFTLNVNKDASIPGTRLAVKGVKQLFRTSDGLEADFRRAMSDIVARHDKFLENIDQKIAGGENAAARLEDGIEALASLGYQFTQNSTEGDEEIVFGSLLSQRTHDSSSGRQSNQYSMTQLSQAEVDEERELLDSSVAGPHEEVDDDTIHSGDDFLCEEDELGEEGLERTLTYLASQAVDAKNDRETFIQYEEEPREELQHYRSQFPIDDNDSAHSYDEANDDTDNFTHLKSERDAYSQHLEEFHVNDIVNDPKKHQDDERASFELATSTGQLVFEPINSLRREDIESQSATWYPLPNDESDRRPPWFKFDYDGSDDTTPVQPNIFLEPVERAPSYNHVRLWMKTHKSDGKLNHAENDPDSHVSTQMAFTQYTQFEQTQDELSDPLSGLGQQGCRVQVSGGGGLKTSIHTPSTFTPMTMMSIEVHVQCRIKTGIKGHKEVAMVPDSSRDSVYAVVYVFARDPGGGENIEIIEKGTILVLIGSRQPASNSLSGISSDVTVESVTSERSLLLRVASIVTMKDPDILLSWDTHGSGIGYLVERGVALGKSANGGDEKVSSDNEGGIDIARLLGRIPKVSCGKESRKTEENAGLNLIDGADKDETGGAWTGSGLGSEWDDRVGAGAAASSIAGRIVICGWKICSEECKHPNASYQPAIVSAVLNKRIPFHDDLLLTRWYSMDSGTQRWRVLEYRLLQAHSNILLLDELDVLGRAGEAARLSGVEFSQSLPGIRGSQYKVEGVLLRALQSVRSNERGEKTGLNTAKSSGWQGTMLTTTLSAYTESQSQTQSPWKRRRMEKQTRKNRISVKDLGYFFYSPSKDDCSKQEALECQAMTLEPLSGFHFDPVVVCDFTALYPSLVIAYNLCYSTVAGKLDYHSTRKEMRCSGKTTQKVGPFQYSERRTAAVIKHHMKSIQGTSAGKKKRDRSYAIPTGSIFVSESVLKGVLPQVLDEMLSTRAMLKKAAKEYKKQVSNLSPAILRQIEARQLALKYVANVTYGYTSATFSGRSAAPLVADAIVECGRRTLTNAINLANRWGKNENGRWHGAQVLYGDTDSVFIKLPGRSVKEAFAFGEEYCTAVTASNPPPVQLKLEKVYAACLLQTKKKYCGMMCESPLQKRPVFEAKGIETVRRDQCALTQKILRNALIKVFQHGITPTKEYLRTQWSLVHAGKFPVSDFVLTGRVRSRYRGGKIGPVQAALARRLGEIDPGRVVRHKERLPYVIVASPGKAFKLRDCVLTPLELLEQWDSYTIHSAYYITKHVNAALQRCFSLAPFNINIHSWYDACPKPRQKIHFWPLSRSGSSLMISSYFGSDMCMICERKCKSTGGSRVAVCPTCSRDKTNVVSIAVQRLNNAQERARTAAAICSECNGCLETSDTFATEVFPPCSKKKYSAISYGSSQRRTGRLCNPMSNCVCIDCPMTYLRHELRELEIESCELMKAIL